MFMDVLGCLCGVSTVLYKITNYECSAAVEVMVLVAVGYSGGGRRGVVGSQYME